MYIKTHIYKFIRKEVKNNINHLLTPATLYSVKNLKRRLQTLKFTLSRKLFIVLIYSYTILRLIENNIFTNITIKISTQIPQE